MTRNSSRPLRQRSSDSREHIYLPHSSWSRAPAAGTTAPLAPEDFWRRLGL